MLHFLTSEKVCGVVPSLSGLFLPSHGLAFPSLDLALPFQGLALPSAGWPFLPGVWPFLLGGWKGPSVSGFLALPPLDPSISGFATFLLRVWPFLVPGRPFLSCLALPSVGSALPSQCLGLAARRFGHSFSGVGPSLSFVLTLEEVNRSLCANHILT